MPEQPQTIYLSKYCVPEFVVESVWLHFELAESVTQVKAVLQMHRNPQAQSHAGELRLNGEAMALLSVALDGQPLTADAYAVDDESLTVFNVPDAFTLETVVEIKPQENTQLSGLYRSRGNYCTQCEAHGFRRITYFFDRPDVMTRFTTTISADKKQYPVLLSNGNLIESKELTDNRHWVKWEDPSLKSCYLFALVAGDLELLEDTFITRSKRDVNLRLYLEKGYLDQGAYALEALKRAMAWDEEVFSREYDLDIYMIVAVSDFNMGAMENKGLNIFNTKYILAKPETATDEDFVAIESVIGHEYFHNWSGNRVTCRDWFQITLKEGLTIFRDQSFTADMTSPVVTRIKDVDLIRSHQFAEDSGPMAHPIRPESYIEVNNFYTMTVYYKGAEVIRMIQTLIGKELFSQAMDEYFSRFDGQAVTTEDFVQVMQDISGKDLTQFKRWYAQAGTPILDCSGQFNAADKTYSLTVKQSTSATPGQKDKKPFAMPLAMGLVGPAGKDLPLQLQGDGRCHGVLEVTEAEQSFVFTDIAEPPVPSLLRNFSAPVKLNFNYSAAQLLHLFKYDTDGFNQREAGQRLMVNLLLALVNDIQTNKKLELNSEFVAGFSGILQRSFADNNFKACLLAVPQESYLLQQLKPADVDAVHQARQFMRRELAGQLRDIWLQVYQDYQSKDKYIFDMSAMGRRAMLSVVLNFLLTLDDQSLRALALTQFQQADNMTDRMAALSALNQSPSVEREQALATFYNDWQSQDLVMDKWLSLQAVAAFPDTLAQVKKLLQHPAYDANNPNKVRALVGAFTRNPVCFHQQDGAGYAFLGEQILLADTKNAQLAARLIEPFTQWRLYNKTRQQLMRQQLELIVATKKLSKDVYEMATKSLEN